LLQKFIAFLKQFNLLHPHNNFIVAVSGGIDSVVLAELCKQAELNFSIAHCNFKLRGEESERDENFVKEIAEKYKVHFHLKTFKTIEYLNKNKVSVQEAARELRYQWFEELQKYKMASHILLAHHANDNIETLLMNFFRGTGLEGLTGMPAKSHTNCFRPLIKITKEEIQQFAKENMLEWVEDSTNESTKYTRNFFRKEIIPQIQKVFPQAEKNLSGNLERFQKINLLYQILVNELKKKLITTEGTEAKIPVKRLMEYRNTSFIYELIKDFGFGEKQVEELIKLAESDSGKYIENDMYRIIKHRLWFIIAPKIEAATTVTIEEGEKQVQFSGNSLEIKKYSIEKFQLNTSHAIAQLDSRDIHFPLLIRKWKSGDYFYPLGMRKKKKLSRFFIDQKLSKTEKEKIWVLESNKKIIWVIGHRIDDRVKVADSTKIVIEFRTSTL
jgi:tRNA(Ile)-lysidine synthase